MAIGQALSESIYEYTCVIGQFDYEVTILSVSLHLEPFVGSRLQRLDKKAMFVIDHNNDPFDTLANQLAVTSVR